jgi:hypothetical protein
MQNTVLFYHNTDVKNEICKHTNHSLHTLTGQANEYMQNKYLHCYTFSLLQDQEGDKRVTTLAVNHIIISIALVRSVIGGLFQVETSATSSFPCFNAG